MFSIRIRRKGLSGGECYYWGRLRDSQETSTVLVIRFLFYDSSFHIFLEIFVISTN